MMDLDDGELQIPAGIQKDHPDLISSRISKGVISNHTNQ